MFKGQEKEKEPMRKKKREREKKTMRRILYTENNLTAVRGEGSREAG